MTGSAAKRRVEGEDFSQDNWSHYGACEDQVFVRCIFRYADLSGTRFHNCEFIGCEFESVDFGNCVFDRCRFESSTLSSTSLMGARFRDCVFRSLSSDAVEEGSGLRPMIISNCNFSSTEFRADSNPEGALFDGFEITNSTFDMAVFKRVRLAGIRQVDNSFTDAVFLENEIEKTDFKDCEYRYMMLHRCKLGDIKFNLQKALTVLGILEALASGPCQISVRYGKETHYIETAGPTRWLNELDLHLNKFAENLRDTHRVFEFIHTQILIAAIRSETGPGNDRYIGTEEIVYRGLAACFNDMDRFPPSVRDMYMIIRLLDYHDIHSSVLVRRIAPLLRLAARNEPWHFRLATEAEGRLRYMAETTPSEAYLITIVFEAGSISEVEREIITLMGSLEVADFSITHFRSGSIEAVIRVLSVMSVRKIVLVLLLLGVKVDYENMDGTQRVRLSYDVLERVLDERKPVNQQLIEQVPESAVNRSSDLISDMSAKKAEISNRISIAISGACVTEIPLSEEPEVRPLLSIGQAGSFGYTVAQAQEPKPPALPD